MASPPTRSGVVDSSWTCLFGLHQRIDDVSGVTLPSQTFAFSGDGSSQVSTGTGYLVQGTPLGQGSLTTESGNSILPSGDQTGLLQWYQNNYNSKNKASGNIWEMYPEASEVEKYPDIDCRHPGNFYEGNCNQE